jgi:hypothetical protein
MQLMSNVVIQRPGEPLGAVLDFLRASDVATHDARGVRLVHVVNPFAQPGNRAHEESQRVTFAAMERAASLAGPGVAQVSVTVPRDRDVAPASFVRGGDLDRTVLDLRSFGVRRPLPLLFDILDRGAAVTGPEDYLIYTNIDICPMPTFYVAVRELIGFGFDAITVNRRTVTDAAGYREFPALAAAEIGTDHGGFDCLIFRRALYDAFVRCDVCIGAPPVARALLFNLVVHCRRMLMLKHVHLTFHLGDDRPWGEQAVADYADFNVAEVRGLMAALSRDPVKLASLAEFCDKHPEPRIFCDTVRALGK